MGQQSSAGKEEQRRAAGETVFSDGFHEGQAPQAVSVRKIGPFSTGAFRQAGAAVLRQEPSLTE
ncbi:hypothetical protein NBH19_06595 [Rhizobium sp. S95]|uniref:Uncharacterized protein n=1 Tax=Ciceribacter sichuanensis TaxID=2949647 RepID=A0AAJ1BZ92_9HYPH|nr:MULTISPECIES: hypothetical protein [unclassified Ciceribacter]MCM2395750.1 hypothetical protein [Ciceribacter sp. S95]MCO5958899.1 hypothetical protein [Ciceribacter sp. S101]